MCHKPVQKPTQHYGPKGCKQHSADPWMRFSQMCINTVAPAQFPSVLCMYTCILVLGRTLLLDSNFWLQACFQVSIVIVSTVTVLQFIFMNMNRGYSFIQYRICWEYSVYWRCDWTQSQKSIEPCNILGGKINCCTVMIDLVSVQRNLSLLSYIFPSLTCCSR